MIGSAYPFENARPTPSRWSVAPARDRGGQQRGWGRRTPYRARDRRLQQLRSESTTTAFNELVSKEVDAVILGYHNVMEPNDILRTGRRS